MNTVLLFNSLQLGLDALLIVSFRSLACLFFHVFSGNISWFNCFGLENEIETGMFLDSTSKRIFLIQTKTGFIIRTSVTSLEVKGFFTYPDQTDIITLRKSLHTNIIAAQDLLLHSFVSFFFCIR